MSKSYEGKNGMARDLAKLKAEFLTWWPDMKPHFTRYLKRPLPHECTNLFVEACRASAYFFGHVLSITWHVLIVVAVILAASAVANAATITFEDGSQVEFPDDWLVSIDITAQQPCEAPPPQTCQDDPSYCAPAELCDVWPDHTKCNLQQLPWPTPPEPTLCERDPDNAKCRRQQSYLWSN
jgi:hypothetical protein